MPESLKEDGRPAQQWYWDDWFSEFGLRLCSLEARGLWIDMLGIMWSAEIRGTLTVNGRQLDSKSLAKLCNEPVTKINACLVELERNEVYSRLPDETIISRRLFRESKKQDHISKIRSKAGQEGAKKRWQKDSKGNNKKITKMAAPSSSPTSTPSSTPTPECNNNINIVFNFKSEKWENITEKDKERWKKTYPLCDINQELLFMADWLVSNPGHKKSNYKRFISNWLKKNQDRGGTKKVGRSTYLDKKKAYMDEQTRKFLARGDDDK